MTSWLFSRQIFQLYPTCNLNSFTQSLYWCYDSVISQCAMWLLSDKENDKLFCYKWIVTKICPFLFLSTELCWIVPFGQDLTYASASWEKQKGGHPHLLGNPRTLGPPLYQGHPHPLFRRPYHHPLRLVLPRWCQILLMGGQIQWGDQQTRTKTSLPWWTQQGRLQPFPT